jgi:hypothetical protein
MGPLPVKEAGSPMENMQIKGAGGRRRIAGAAVRFGVLAWLASFILFAAAAFARDLLTVVQRETAIREEKRLLSKKVATVREGDQVAQIEADGSWLHVEFQGAEGWLPASAVSSDRKVVLSGQAVASGVRATEQSAGARGFNPEVEARHKRSRGDLPAAYRQVDRIQEQKFAEELIARFVREGKLGDSVAQGDPAGDRPGAAGLREDRGRRGRGRETPPWSR